MASQQRIQILPEPCSPHHGRVAVGIDVGKVRDPTAIAAVEVPMHSTAASRVQPVLSADALVSARFLERVPLGTPYQGIASHICDLLTSVHERCSHRPNVLVDATGVGQPVVDLLRQSAPPAHLWATIFAPGDRLSVDPSRRTITLGKTRLVRRLQSLLEGSQLRLPHTTEARALANELRTYEIRVDQTGRPRFGTFRAGQHDDLVTALGLAVLALSLPDR